MKRSKSPWEAPAQPVPCPAGWFPGAFPRPAVSAAPSCWPCSFHREKPGAASLTCLPRHGTTHSAWTRAVANLRRSLGARTTRSGERPGGCRASGLGRGAGPPLPRPGALGRLPSAVWPPPVQDTSGQSWPRWPGSRAQGTVSAASRFCLLYDSQGEEAGQVQARWVPPATHGHLCWRALPRHWGSLGPPELREGSVGPEPAGRGWAGVALHPEPWSGGVQPAGLWKRWSWGW